MDKLLFKYQEYRADAEREASPTNEAARGILDKMRDAARSAGIIGPETPSVMSPTGDLGKMPEAPKEPVSIRASTPQEAQKAKAAPTAQEAYDPSQAGLVESSVQAAKSQGAQALGNTYAGAADFYGTLDSLAGIVSRKAGMGKPEVFDYLKRSSEYWAEHYHSKVSIDDYMTRVVGGVLGSGPALTEFAMGTGWAALKGFAEDGNLADALYSAGRRAAAGAVFKSAHTLDPAARIGAGAAYMTGESVVEQLGHTGTIDAGETAEAAGVGLGMMLSGGMKPGNKAGMRQRVDAGTWFETSKQGNEIYKAEQEGRIDTLTKDLAKEFYTADLMRGGTALNDTSMVVIDRVNLLRKGVDDWILADQGITPDPAKDYTITGKTTTRAAEDGTYSTAIELYQGAKANTLVEEWMHREYDRLPASERRAVTRAHDAYRASLAAGDPVMSEAEFYAKGATDKLFADQVAAQKAANRPAWLKAVDAGKTRWDSFVQAVRGVPGAKEDGSAPAMKPGETSENFQAAYHGSPYRFDKFSLDHMGKGEGAQAFGWGLYFAGDKEVAEYYRKALSDVRYGDHIVQQAKDFLKDKHGVDPNENWGYANEQDYIRLARTEGFTFEGDKNKGQLYEVTIPEANTMLDWDKPLSEQPEQVKKALGDASAVFKPGMGYSSEAELRTAIVGDDGVTKADGSLKKGLTIRQGADGQWNIFEDGLTGEKLYRELVRDKGSDRAASEYLKSIGIPGLRYLDGTSRGKGEGSHNYVVFDDAQIAIDKTYYQAKEHPALAGVDMNDAAQVAEAQKLWAEKGVESPYFKRWFGGSKVVDAQGKPLVVAHGTNYEGDIEVFKQGYGRRGAKRDTEYAPSIGIWFTGGGRASALDYGYNTSEHYLSLKNPADFRDPATLQSLLDDGVLKKFGKDPNSLASAIQDGSFRDLGEKSQKIQNSVLRWAKSTGYDGAILNDWSRGDEHVSYVAFSPTQIKSVSNRGTFDASDPRISYQVRPVEIEELYRGENTANKGGNYFSSDREFARNFTHSGRDAEIKTRFVNRADIYEPAKLPFAGDVASIDAAMSEAKAKGYKALRVNEGEGQPNSVYVFDKEAAFFTRNGAEKAAAGGQRSSFQVRPVDEIIYDPTPAPPAAQKLADDGRFNLSNFKSDADLLKLLNDVSRAYTDSPEVIEQARGVRPESMVRTEASTPAMLDIGKHLATRPGTVPTDVEMKASGFIVERLAEQAVPIIAKSKMPDATPEDIAEARKAILLLARARTVDIGLGAEASRSLGARRQRTATEDAQAYIDASSAAIKKWGNERNVDAIADGVLEMIGPDGKIPGAKLGRFMDSVNKASTFDMILEARYMAMLANPATHLKNTLGNSVALMSQIPERAVAEGIGAIRGLFSKEAIDRVEAGETMAMMYGGIEGLRAGATAFVRAVRTGESTDPLGKLETTRRAITAENMGVDAESAWGKMIDFTAERLRTGNMLLGAEDDFFKAIGYSMELNARAHRAASSEGLKGQEFADRIQELVTNPPWDMQMQAMDFAHYSTFTNALGEGLTKLQGALGTDRTVTLKSGKTYEVPTGKLFRLAVPFFRTPANLVNYGLKRSPFAPFMPSVQQDLINGGAARDMAISRIALGSTLGFMAAQAASAGLITGGGPSDPKQRENMKAVGWQEYSFGGKGKWTSYQAFEPFSMLIGAAADIALFDDYLEDNERNNAVMMVGGAFSEAITSKTFMRGMNDLLNVLFDPQRYGESSARNFTTSFVPAPVKAIRRDVDPITREMWSITDALKNSLPGYSSDLYPRRNRYGEVVTMGEVWLSNTVDPVRKSEIKNAENSPTYAIDKAIMENNVPIPRPGKVLHWEGVKIELTPEEYDTFQMLPRDLGLVEALQNVVASETFAAASGGPDGIKSNMIREVFGDFREQARYELVTRSQGVPGGIAERIEIEKLQTQMMQEAAR